MTRILGLDVGDRRIGVALSDPGGILASPLIIIEHSDERQAIKAILDIINQYQVREVIVGLPRSLDGGIGTQAEKVQVFVKNLSSYIEIPVEFRDERLTTVSARRLMKKAAIKKTRKKASDDAVAAAIILQGYLDEVKT